MVGADQRLPAKTAKHVADERGRQHLKAKREDCQQQEYEQLLDALTKAAEVMAAPVDNAPVVAEDDGSYSTETFSEDDNVADDPKGAKELTQVKIQSPEVEMDIGNDDKAESVQPKIEVKDHPSEWGAFSPVTPCVDTVDPPPATPASSPRSTGSDELK